ncbi:MAG: outer membrane lipoprotein carrier protein LolA [Desulfobacterales bacterium]
MKKLILVLLCFAVGFLASCQKQTTVDDVVAMLTEAQGGAQKLAEITDQVSTWEFTMHVMPPGMPEGVEGPMTSPMSITAKRPNKLRFDTYGPDGSIVASQCFDGTTGWNMQGGERADMSEEETQEYAIMASTWIDGFVNYADKGFTLELLPDEMVDDQNYMVLQASTEAGHPQKYYINPETHLIERQAGEMRDMGGEMKPMVMTLKDYQMVDGIAMSYDVALLNEDGSLVWEARLKDAKHNTGLEDTAFMAGELSAK